MKLGKLAPKVHPSTLRLAKYLPQLKADSDFGVALPTPPPKVYWEFKVPESQWQMFANDTIGDCTCACIAHMLMNATAHTGELFIPPKQDVIDFYSAVTGYDPSNPATDQGAAITDVLDRWKNVGLSGHKILGWAAIDAGNIEHVKLGNYIFGGVDIGFNVPEYAMEQVAAMMDWTIMQADQNIVGGHSVNVLGHGSKGAACITWGKIQRMSWDFFTTFCDEGYVVITEDWMRAGVTPSGFDMDALKADLAALSVPPAS